MCIQIIMKIKAQAETFYQERKKIRWFAGKDCTVHSWKQKIWNNWSYWTVNPQTQYSETQNTYEVDNICLLHWASIQMEGKWNHTRSVTYHISTTCCTEKNQLPISYVWNTWQRNTMDLKEELALLVDMPNNIVKFKKFSNGLYAMVTNEKRVTYLYRNTISS